MDIDLSVLDLAVVRGDDTVADVIAAVNVIVATTREEAAEELHRATRSRVGALLAPGRLRGHADADELIVVPAGPSVEGRLASLELPAEATGLLAGSAA